MHHHSLLVWVGFGLFVIAMLVLDLGVFHRRAHAIKVKEALLLSAFWIALALLFNLGIFLVYGPQQGLKFLTGYLLEKSLSVDNLFVFLLVFSYFRVPPQYQHKVLFWGILGALVLRGIFIALGIALIQRFHFIVYFFGIFLIYTGIKLYSEKDKEIHPEKNPMLKLFRRVMPVSSDFEGSKFFVRTKNCLTATPLMVVLIVVETTDVIFALDSIPAILAVTTDPFIVYTSNVFAILGLRALYFTLEGMMRLFHHLHYALCVILVFIGIKMLIQDHYPIPIGFALGFILAVLTASVLSSIICPKQDKPLI